MKRKLFIGILAFVIVSSACGLYVYNTKFNAASENTMRKGVNVSFNENRLGEDELIKKSSLIAKCKVTGLKEKATKTADTVSPDGEKFTVTAPTATYTVKVIDSLKGDGEDEIELVLLDGQNGLIDVGGEYVLFLHKNPTEKTYSLTSYNQGVNKFKNSNEIESVKTKEVLNYKGIEDKIKQVKN